MPSGERGVYYIAFGEAALKAVRLSVASLRRFWDGPVNVICDQHTTVEGAHLIIIPRCNPDAVWESRMWKIKLADTSKYQSTLYLDADTLVRQPIDEGFSIVEDGFDLAMTHSAAQGKELLWHVEDDEREYTIAMLGTFVQMQAGVMFWRKGPQVGDLFWEWRKQYSMYRGQDQAAFTRALFNKPVKVALLGRPWNGGAIIEHRFGRARNDSRA